MSAFSLGFNRLHYILVILLYISNNINNIKIFYIVTILILLSDATIFNILRKILILCLIQCSATPQKNYKLRPLVLTKSQWLVLTIPQLLFFICVQGFGILFRSVKFSAFFPNLLISALLRGLQKMAASKPIS